MERLPGFGELPQALPGTTTNTPEENVLVKLTVAEVVPCPPVMLAFKGAYQVYVVAPNTAAILYAWEPGAQIVGSPLIVGDDADGGPKVIVRQLAVLLPQLLLSATHRVPELKVLVKLTITEVVP